MDCRAAESRGSTIRRWQWTSEKCLETKRTALVSCLSWLSYPRQYTQNANLMRGLRAACSVFDPLQTARRLNRRTSRPCCPLPSRAGHTATAAGPDLMIVILCAQPFEGPPPRYPCGLSPVRISRQRRHIIYRVAMLPPNGTRVSPGMPRMHDPARPSWGEPRRRSTRLTKDQRRDG